MVVGVMSVFILLSSSVSIFGSGTPTKEAVITIGTGNFIPSNLFVLSGLKNRQLCEALGCKSKPTDPFIQIKFLGEQDEAVTVPDKIKDLDALPVACFTAGDCFKKNDEDILSFIDGQNTMVCFKVRNKDQRMLTILKSKQFFDQFNRQPNYFVEDSEELVREGVIEFNGSSLAQWPKKTIFNLYLKKPFLFLVGLALVFALYKKCF